MAEGVYALCSILSGFCALLLLRSFRTTGSRLLLWSGLAFVGLAANNVLLWVDLVMVPQVDLAVLRVLVALAAVMSLLVGLVWESNR